VSAEPPPPIGDLFARTASFYRRYLRLIMLVTLPVVASVDLVIGAGLGELTASAHKQIQDSDIAIGFAAEFLVTVPIVTVGLARAVVIDRAGPSPPSAKQVLQEALDLFVPTFAVVLAALCAVVVGLALLFVIPGIFLAVSWFFVVQAVAIDRRRGLSAIRLSAALVRGRWLHTAAVGASFLIVLLFAALIPEYVFGSLAIVTNLYVLAVVGAIVADTVVLPFLAIGSTLYYLDLRSRAGMSPAR
jgi:hypothetical protein